MFGPMLQCPRRCLAPLRRSAVAVSLLDHSSAVQRRFFIRSFTAAMLIALAPLWTGCHYYEEYRVLKSKADLQEEQAELLRAYRLCLTKYEEEPAKAKEVCAPYTQRLREIEVRHQSGR